MADTSNLTPRQVMILKAIIDEYISSAEAVGSETLEKKHNLGISPATIRNEMVKLTEMKLLHQPHTSSGRSPTPEALKFYVENLMKTKELSVAEEMSMKEKVWDYRQEVDKLLREATKILAVKTKTLALTATKGGDLYYAGASHILDMPEFYDYELTHSLLATLDEAEFWWNILEAQEQDIDIMIGQDLDKGILSQCGFVYHKFSTPLVSGGIGIVGPSRMNYPAVVPVVRYMGDLIRELVGQW